MSRRFTHNFVVNNRKENRMSTENIRVMKGAPPEVAANYFAIDRKRKLFGSGKTAKAARNNLALMVQLVKIVEREERQAARKVQGQTGRRRR